MRGIAGEADAGAAGLAQVAEDHGLHVDRGAQHVVDVVDAAIVLGAIVQPGAEHGVARHDQLLVRILRKLVLGVLLHDLLVFGDHFLQRLGVEVGVELGLLLFLLAVENFFERVLGNVEHHAAEHLDQAAIGVIGEARIVAALGQAFDRLVIQAEVEDGVHHAGHGELCARAHADQQRIVGAAELLSLELLQAPERLVHLAIDLFGNGVVRHVFAAGFGLDGEAGRNGKSGIGHLGQAGAFAAEFVLHLAVTFGVAVAKEVDVLHGVRVGSRCVQFSSSSAHRRSFIG